MNDASSHSKGHILQNELLTVREVAAYLRVSRVTAWRWCQEGVIPAFRIGRTWRIRRDDLLDLEKSCNYYLCPPGSRSTVNQASGSRNISSSDNDPDNDSSN